MILMECSLDEFLVKTLGYQRKQIKHEGGKGKVLGILRKKDWAIGIIDEDPDTNQPSEINNYVDKDIKGRVKLMENNKNNRKKIIQISPYLEDWLIFRAKQNQISLKKI